MACGLLYIAGIRRLVVKKSILCFSFGIFGALAVAIFLQSCAGKETKTEAVNPTALEKQRAADAKSSPSPVSRLGLQVEIKENTKTHQHKLVGLGKVSLEVPSDSDMHLFCDLPLKMEVTKGSKVKLERAVTHTMNKILKSIETYDLPPEKKGTETQYFSTGFFKMKDGKVVDLRSGTVSDLYGNYQLKTSPVIEKIDHEVEAYFENEKGVSFVLPVQKGFTEPVVITVSEGAGAADSKRNISCISIMDHGFRLVADRK